MKNVIFTLLLCGNFILSFSQSKGYINYITTSGDNLNSILRKFAMSEADLQKINPGLMLDAIIPGLKIKVLAQNSLLDNTQKKDANTTTVSTAKSPNLAFNKVVDTLSIYQQKENKLQNDFFLIEKDGMQFKLYFKNILSASINQRNFLPTTTAKRKKELEELASKDENVKVIETDGNGNLVTFSEKLYYKEEKANSTELKLSGGNDQTNLLELLKLIKSNNISVTVSVYTNDGVKELNLDKTNLVGN